MPFLVHATGTNRCKYEKGLDVGMFMSERDNYITDRIELENVIGGALWPCFVASPIFLQ